MHRIGFYISTVFFMLFSFLSANAQQKKAHEFDDLNRLTKVSVYNAGTLTHTITYTFDEVGNRLSTVVNVICPTSQILSEIKSTGTLIRAAANDLTIQNTAYNGTVKVTAQAAKYIIIKENTLFEKGAVVSIQLGGCPNTN